MLPSFISPEIIPHKPGIYIYKDKTRKIIYVGKAVDLFSRVSSYFSKSWKDLKTVHLVADITSVETIIVESELEALILEANLIKKHKPHYNIRLTDDKDYLYIVVTDEEFPKVLTARKKDIIKVKKWFGPYPSATIVKTALRKLRRVFPWCSGKGQGLSVKGKVNRKACFYYHLNLCPGACIGVINHKEYMKIINCFSKFLEGKKQELLGGLTLEMGQYSKDLKFEQAFKVKKIIEGITYLTSPTKITNYLANPNFLEDLNKNSLEELRNVLNLPELPVRIEAYDISNFQGSNATGSMVVLTNGDIDKSQYRRFKIKIAGRPNDVGMHKEMMGRRLTHLEWPLPQLFLIDGGRGQAYAIAELCNLKGINVPVFGLAKIMEWIYPPKGEVLKLPKRSLALRLLQKIRDESHRFAISYHRKLRKKAFLPIE